MTEKSVLKYSSPYYSEKKSANFTEASEILVVDYGYTPLQVAGLLCFLAGTIQVMRRKEKKNDEFNNLKSFTFYYLS